MRLIAALAALLVSTVAQAAPRTILFVGNSFTFAATSPAMRYRADSVKDLNGGGIGGVPAIFERFAGQAGLDYAVSLETKGGSGLDWHYQYKRAVIDRRWDVVVLQGYSTLDGDAPGNPAKHIRFARALAELVTRANRDVQVELVSTWSRADLVHRPGSPWSGTPVAQMAIDLRRASDAARAATRDIDGVVPVGEAWNRAFAEGLADPNPYDGITFGQIDLWGWDQYHASAAGYYLEALVIFGRVTGRDPRTLGRDEKAAEELGIRPEIATALQRIAWEQLRAG